MIGKASEIEILVLGGVNEYYEWKNSNTDAEIIDIKFSTVQQNDDFQNSFGVLIIYKEASQ